jgi:hypothetical protein
MCECVSWCGLEILDALLSVFILLLNGICAIWGFILPHSNLREDVKKYTETLELYVDIVSYSDAVLIPLKVITIILVKACICNCERCQKRLLDNEDVINDNKFRDVSNVCSDVKNNANGKCNIIIYRI